METIKKVEDRFRVFLESLPDAIIIVNSDGIIQIVNSQTEKLFGYKRDEIVGKEVEKLMPSHHRNAHHVHRKSFGVKMYELSNFFLKLLNNFRCNSLKFDTPDKRRVCLNT